MSSSDMWETVNSSMQISLRVQISPPRGLKTGEEVLLRPMPICKRSTTCLEFGRITEKTDSLVSYVNPGENTLIIIKPCTGSKIDKEKFILIF